MRARRSLIAAARHGLHPGRLGWLMRASQRGLRLRLGLPVRAPLYATLALTWRCNYRCFMCDFPLREDPVPDTADLLERVRGLARRGALAVGITGGEPLAHRGALEVVAEAQRLGLLVHLNTNGSELTLRKMPELVASGLHSLNFSVDGGRPDTHDTLRRTPGSFQQIEETVARWREAGPSRPRLGLVMVISRRNHHEVREFVELARRWNVDAASFLPHHPFLDDAEDFEERELAALRQSLLEVADEVDNSPVYLEGLTPFLAGGPTPRRCSAPESHLAIDPGGTAYPCVPLMTLERSGIAWQRLGRASPRPSPADREEVCRRCWWNCHRELDLTLGVLTRRHRVEDPRGRPSRAAPAGSSPS